MRIIQLTAVAQLTQRTGVRCSGVYDISGRNELVISGVQRNQLAGCARKCSTQQAAISFASISHAHHSDARKTQVKARPQAALRQRGAPGAADLAAAQARVHRHECEDAQHDGVRQRPQRHRRISGQSRAAALRHGLRKRARERAGPRRRARAAKGRTKLSACSYDVRTCVGVSCAPSCPHRRAPAARKHCRCALLGASRVGALGAAASTPHRLALRHAARRRHLDGAGEQRPAQNTHDIPRRVGDGAMRRRDATALRCC